MLSCAPVPRSTLIGGRHRGSIYTVKPSIAAAAIRVGERIFTGETHVDAIAKLVRAPRLSAEEKIQMILSGEAGFITDDGQFVNRDEAHTISQQAGVVQ